MIEGEETCKEVEDYIKENKTSAKIHQSLSHLCARMLTKSWGPVCWSKNWMDWNISLNAQMFYKRHLLIMSNVMKNANVHKP